MFVFFSLDFVGGDLIVSRKMNISIVLFGDFAYTQDCIFPPVLPRLADGIITPGCLPVCFAHCWYKAADVFARPDTTEGARWTIIEYYHSRNGLFWS